MNKAILIAAIIIAFLIGRAFGIGNQVGRYGDYGDPKNCRALIAENIDGYKSGEFTPEDALASIDRNCGRFGLIWHIR